MSQKMSNSYFALYFSLIWVESNSAKSEKLAFLGKQTEFTLQSIFVPFFS